jgi:hypothetical protein
MSSCEPVVLRCLLDAISMMTVVIAMTLGARVCLVS